MTFARRLALAWLVGLLALLALPALAATSSGPSRFCDRSEPLTAAQQDLLLRFSARIGETLAESGSDMLLISRSGLDLSRFRIRYSHAAVAWRDDQGRWAARQLYYACDEGRPRLYDQGLAGFAMGIDDPSQGYVSIVRLPAAAGEALRAAALDRPLTLHLLAGRYSANAYAWSARYQNCNQWLAELMAAAWGGLPLRGDEVDGGLRERAQRWLGEAGYAPEPVEVGSRWLMFAGPFVPLLHFDDHPRDDLYAMRLRISLPASLEAFVRGRWPGSERTELCHDGRRIVVHRGWSPVADGCVPAEGDEVQALD